MSLSTEKAKKILKGKLPDEVVSALIDEYLHIKQQFFLKKFQPTELNGGRFSECVLRVIEFVDKGASTPLGTKIDSEKIIKSAESNTGLKDTLRFLLPRLCRVILDVRNKRDIGHPGGDVSPNFSDSQFVVHSADWVLTELVRHFYTCSIDEAKTIVQDINELKIPIIADIDGFIRVQNTKLQTYEKILVILYYKSPDSVSDKQLQIWLRYKNTSDFRKILEKMDNDVLIHYENRNCTILPKGSIYVETKISTQLIV